MHERIRPLFDFESRQIAETSKEIKNTAAESATKHMAYAQEGFLETAKANRIIIPALAAARKELELSSNEKAFAETLYNAQVKAEEQLSGFLHQVSVNVHNPSKDS